MTDVSHLAFSCLQWLIIVFVLNLILSDLPILCTFAKKNWTKVTFNKYSFQEDAYHPLVARIFQHALLRGGGGRWVCLWAWGVSVPGGVSASGPGGVCASQHALGQTSMDRMTDKCKNITFANFVCGWKLVELISKYYYCLRRSWGKVIFSEVCVRNSVHGGGLPHCMLWYTPTPSPPDQRQAPWDQTPPQTGTPRDQTHSPWDKTPPNAVHAGRYGQKAGGTHPTGMQSCCYYFWCV